MNSHSVFEQLDQAIDQINAGHSSYPADSPPEVAELLDIASDLQHLPRVDFKSRLKTELQWVASGRPVSSSRPVDHAGDMAILPSLSGKGYGLFPVRRANFAASVALHAAMVLFASFGLLMVRHTEVTDKPVGDSITLVSPYVLPPSTGETHGGGGGGVNSKSQASHGEAPPFAFDQIVPPTVEIQNSKPKLAMPTTIVGSPDLNLPQTKPIGDPLAALTSVASGGIGFSGGIGGGKSGGDGIGNGLGIGPGRIGGIGGGAFSVGNGVTAPRVIYNPDPEYSEEARKAHYQGTVSLLAIIGPDGVPRYLHIERSLGMGLDEKALEAVRKWRFEPGTKDGHPVSVAINVLVDFRLY